MAASPGAATGAVVFSSDEAVEQARNGIDVILVRPETTPDDIHGMAAAIGILTSQGGKTSHAAVVARGMGKPAVTGAAKLQVDTGAGIASAGNAEVRRGDVITIDGTSGGVYQGEIELVPPEVPPELDELLEWADELRSLGVRANADTAEDAALARQHGAEGIGLARTEHMFLGERLSIVQRVILSTDLSERERALADLEKQQVGDFESLLEAMDGLPVVIPPPRPSPSRVPPLPPRVGARDVASSSRRPAHRRPAGHVRPGRTLGGGQSDARVAWGPARAHAQGPLPDAGPGRHARRSPGGFRTGVDLTSR